MWLTYYLVLDCLRKGAMGTALVVVVMAIGCLQLPAELLSAKVDGAVLEQMTTLHKMVPFQSHHSPSPQSTVKEKTINSSELSGQLMCLGKRGASKCYGPDALRDQRAARRTRSAEIQALTCDICEKLKNWAMAIHTRISAIIGKRKKTDSGKKTSLCERLQKFASKGGTESENINFEVTQPGQFSILTLLSKGSKYLKYLKIDVNKLHKWFQSITYNCETMKLSIKTKPIKRMTLIPKLLHISDVVVTVQASLEKETRGLLLAKFQSKWNFLGLVMNVLISYSPAKGELTIKSLLARAPTTDVKGSLQKITGQKIPLPVPSFKLQKLSIEANIGTSTTTKGNVSVVISGLISGFKFFFILQKSSGDPETKYNFAVAAELSNFKLSVVFKRMVGVDISRVPLLGPLTIKKLQITYARRSISSPLFSKLLSGMEQLLEDDTISEGLRVVADLMFGSKQVSLMVSHVQGQMLTITSLSKGSLSLHSLFMALGMDLKKLPLPSGIKDLLNVGIQTFQLDTATSQLDLDFDIPNKLSYFNGKFVIENLSVTIHASLKKPKNFTIAVKGDFVINKQKFQVDIREPQPGKGYRVQVNMDELSLPSLMKVFKVPPLPPQLKFIEKSPFFQVRLKNVRIMYPISARPLQLHISGTPEIYGMKTTHINVVFVKIAGSIKVVLGYQLGSASLVDVVKKATGKSIGKIGMLKRKLATTVMVCPSGLAGIKLYGKMLNKMALKQGVSIKSNFKWPSDCSSSKFCKVAQRILGKNARMSLEVNIENPKKFKIAAQIENVIISRGLILTQAELYINVGLNINFGIAGKLFLPKQKIHFFISITTGVKGVELKGKMGGCWNKAFGASWLSICNLILSVAIQPTAPTIIGALEFGGEIRLGKCRPRIIIQGYVGLDEQNPRNDYFYLKLGGAFTLGRMMHAFLCKNVKMPKPLAESGFPEGFESSFSLAGKSLPFLKIYIPSGYRLKAKFNILGLVGFVDLTISLPKGFKLLVELPRINVAGLLKMYMSEKDKSKGPYLKANIVLRPQKKFDIEAKGYVSVLGVSLETSLKISPRFYQFSIRGKFLKYFEASLKITAGYQKISSARFEVEGEFRNDLFAMLRKKVTGFLKRSADKASKKLDQAKAKIRKAKAPFDAAIRKLKQKQQDLDKAKRPFDSAIRNLEGKKRKIQNICHLKRCGHACIGCPSGWHCYKKVWGKCIIGRPGWNSCCKRITNPICLAANAACTVLRKTLQAGIIVAQKIVEGAKRTIDIAKAALYAAQLLVKGARGTLDIAVAGLELVKRVMRAGIQALTAIVKVGLGGLIDIRRVYFRAALGKAGSGSFTGRIRVSFLGRSPVQFSLYIDFKNVWKMVKQLVSRIFGKKAMWNSMSQLK